MSVCQVTQVLGLGLVLVCLLLGLGPALWVVGFVLGLEGHALGALAQVSFSYVYGRRLFTARSPSYASAVLGVIILSVCPYVRPSVCHTRAL